MSGLVLIVEGNDAERYRLREAFQLRDVGVHEVRDAVGAMGVLGRSEVAAILMAAGPRQLSLRGLCQLARRKHPEVVLLLRGDTDQRAALKASLHPDLELIASDLGPEDTADSVCDHLRALDGFGESTSDGFDVDLDVDVGEGGGWDGDDWGLDYGGKAPPGPSAPMAEPPPTAPGAPKRRGPDLDVPDTQPSIQVDLGEPEPEPKPEPSVEVDVGALADDEPTARLPVAPTPADAEATERLPAAPAADDVDATQRLPAAPSLADAPESAEATGSQPASPEAEEDPTARIPIAPKRTADAEPTERVKKERPSFADSPETAPGMEPPPPFEPPEEGPLPHLEAPVLDVPAAGPPSTEPATDLGGASAAGAVPVPGPEPEAEPVALLDGDLAEGGGAALLMALYAQDLTGRLQVKDGDARGDLYFHKGNPVAVEHPDGDAGLRKQLVDKGLIPAEVTLSPPEGELLAAIVDRELVPGADMQDFLRELVRDRVLALCMQHAGDYLFWEDEAFVHRTPLLKVNPFGLALEARRRLMPPADVLRMAGELKEQQVVPQPMLRDAAHKLSGFVRGQDLSELLPTPRRIGDLLADAGLDDLMGTLLVIALDDTRLVEIKDAAQPAQTLPMPAQPARSQAVDASLPDAAPIADEDDEVRALASEIASLYMKLKPLTRPTQVLGIEPGATSAETQAAYERLIASLEAMKVPDGETHANLRARLAELKSKVNGAYAVLNMGEL